MSITRKFFFFFGQSGVQHSLLLMPSRARQTPPPSCFVKVFSARNSTNSFAENEKFSLNKRIFAWIVMRLSSFVARTRFLQKKTLRHRSKVFLWFISVLALAVHGFWGDCQRNPAVMFHKSRQSTQSSLIFMCGEVEWTFASSKSTSNEILINLTRSALGLTFA